MCDCHVILNAYYYYYYYYYYWLGGEQCDQYSSLHRVENCCWLLCRPGGNVISCVGCLLSVLQSADERRQYSHTVPFLRGWIDADLHRFLSRPGTVWSCQKQWTDTCEVFCVSGTQRKSNYLTCDRVIVSSNELTYSTECVPQNPVWHTKLVMLVRTGSTSK